jgi:hypothetical protein
MESDLLKIVNDEMLKLNINYEYGEYKGELKYPYVVGEYNERDYKHEDNITSGEFILTVFHRGSENDLINIKEQIKNVFADFRASTTNGTAFISYRTKLFIRSGEEELKKMEIYLDTKSLKGV